MESSVKRSNSGSTATAGDGSCEVWLRFTECWHNITKAPARRVYDALATAEGLRWWAPHRSTQTDDGLVLAHSPGPAHGDVQMKVLESLPVERVIWEIISTHLERSPASAWTGTRMRFEISEKPCPGHWMGRDNEGETMTVVDFYHSGWDDHSEFLGFCSYAWGVILDMLRNWCESE